MKPANATLLEFGNCSTILLHVVVLPTPTVLELSRIIFLVGFSTTSGTSSVGVSLTKTSESVPTSSCFPL